MTDNHWPEHAPTDGDYLTFTAGHDEDKAAARYREKHGTDPEWLFESDDGLLRAGPIGGHRV